MDTIALLVALGLVFLNGFFVATEFALVKVRPTRIEELHQQNRRGANTVQQVLRQLDGYLSATQLGITLASLGLGWVGEPAFARLVEIPLLAAGMSDPLLVHGIASACAFASISFLHIVLGELVPKSIALVKAETVALAVALPMRAFYTLFLPIIWALNGVASAVMKLVGMPRPSENTDHHHTPDELKIIVAQARSAGLLSHARSNLLSKVLSLSSKTAESLMVPRGEVEYLDINLSLEDNLKVAFEAGHTHYPLCDRELDNVKGVVDIRHLLMAIQRGENVTLESAATEAAFIPEIMAAERLLFEFRRRRVSMVIVVDEYGGTSGIATPNDLVCAVMGELTDNDTDIIRLPEGHYIAEGTTSLEEISEALSIPIDTDEVNTVAGLLMERLVRIPKAGDQIVLQGFAFKVLEMEGPRVKRVKITPLATPENSV